NSIGNLANLRSLDVSGNHISRLPESIGNLVSLEELNLEENLIHELPESIGNLINLRKLNLMNNPDIYKLPSSFSMLTSLDELSIIIARPGNNRVIASKAIMVFSGLAKWPEGVSRLTRAVNDYVIETRVDGDRELAYLCIDENSDPIDPLRQLADELEVHGVAVDMEVSFGEL
ncbi:MAG: leucine-rich repeat domain-containing protein, partial [Candidatus Sigynarchaeota archaeon]